jgi:hypothetical protein
VEPLSRAWYIEASIALVCFAILFLASFTVPWPKWLRVISRILAVLGFARILLGMLLSSHSFSPGIYHTLHDFNIVCRVSFFGVALLFLIGGARHGGLGKWLDRRKAPRRNEKQ